MITLIKGDSKKFNTITEGKYINKAKLVYLDPPYNSKRNRGARKIYNDKSNNWREEVEQVIEESYKLLRDDGFLAISINQTELFNLKNIVDEIFSPELFVGLFPVKIRHKDRQLMINATFHDVYEYILIYRKNKKTRFICEEKLPNIDKFCYKINIIDDNPIKTSFGGKNVEIYEKNQYEIIKEKGSSENFRRYIIAGKIKTANWSGEWFELYLRQLGNDRLIKVEGLENQGLGYRWFQTQTSNRKSGVYYQSAKGAGRPLLPTNDLDYTDEVTNIYMEGGKGCDFKDSKKPEKLLQWLIEITTNCNDLVIDLYGGSGTTAAMAYKTQRNCVISEKYQKSFDIIKTRMSNLGLEDKIEIIK